MQHSVDEAVLAVYQCSINAVTSKSDCNKCKLYQMHTVETIHCIVQCPQGNGMESFKSNRDALVVLPPPLVLPYLGASNTYPCKRAVRAETCAYKGWRSTWLGWFKNESHAKSRQLDVSGKQVSRYLYLVTLWCITYRDSSMATPLWLFHMSLWLWVRLKYLFLICCPCPRYKMLVRQWYGEAGAQNRGQ